MKRMRPISENESQWSCKEQFSDQHEVVIVQQKNKEEDIEIYKCGIIACGRSYRSYTAFYNHCKKSHDGKLPSNSLLNGEIFEGPSKNRGRPRITQSNTKTTKQIKAKQRENDIIEFLGDVNGEKLQEFIVFIQDPGKNIHKATQLINKRHPKNPHLLQIINKLNMRISEYDLPQFYDPLQHHLYKNSVDTYSFQTLMNFFESKENKEKCHLTSLDTINLKIIMIIWLGRIVSYKILSQIILILLQEDLKVSLFIDSEEQVELNKHLKKQKSKAFLEMATKCIQCYLISPTKKQ